MTPCTLWFRLVRNPKGYEAFEFNHLEDGHCANEKPTVKFPEQAGWTRSTWQKEFCHLTPENPAVVVHHKDPTESA